jgi:hypothetical protein
MEVSIDMRQDASTLFRLGNTVWLPYHSDYHDNG